MRYYRVGILCGALYGWHCLSFIFETILNLMAYFHNPFWLTVP
jgi:hypothetical protein